MFWALFIASFVAMEFAAWALHKYVMHGFLWVLHRDHHVPNHRRLQKNDSFAIVFAVPSFLFILFGNLYGMPGLAGSGYGILAYGATYFFIHEAIIHRRVRFVRGRGLYFRALIMAHREHHRLQSQHGASSFGMLIVHAKYFRKASSRTRSSAQAL